MEPFAGAWQRNVKVRFDSVLSYHADFACRTLIASDISKLCIKLVQRDDNGIWTEVSKPAYSPVLKKPNRYQNRMQFLESWVLSKLQTGNTYVLKQRDNRNVVVALYVLDPKLVMPLISDDGGVYYQISADQLSQVSESIVVPASEIIHDRFNCFFHPLVGLSPIFAGGLAAMQGLAIQNDSTTFFQNGAQPGGVLIAPGSISDTTTKELKAYWQENFSGKNSGKIAVLGDGLKYEPMKAKSVDMQLIDQLRWTGEVVCSTYHVPPYKAGIAPPPANANIQALNLEYYTQCLQVLIEAIELCLDEGLGTGDKLGTEFDVDNLLRMDSVTQMEVLDKASGVMTIDEKRKRINLAPTEGGSAVYLQQQNFSLAALAKRDAKEDPFATGADRAKTPLADDAVNDNVMQSEADKAMIAILKGFSR